MFSTFVETNGISLHVIDYGGPGPALILTHGLTANATFFTPLVAAGLGDGVRVLSVDLRGRGLSDKPVSGYSMADHADDVLGVMDHFGVEKAYVGGHSFGGLLTYFLAARNPERIRRCVVMDAPGEVDPVIVEQIGPSLSRLEATVSAFEEYLAAVKVQPYYAECWTDALEDYYRADVEELPDGSVKPRSSPDHIRQALEATLDVDWPDLVSRVRAPTLLIRATGSFGPEGYPPILGADAAARTLAALPSGKLIEIAGNHLTAFFDYEVADAASAIRSFILEDT